MRTRRPLSGLVVGAALCAGLLGHSAAGDEAYTLPPKIIVDILDAPPIPEALVSPTRRTIALLERTSMPTIAEHAEPMLRLAGRRINPRTNGQRTSTVFGVTLKSVADGSVTRVAAPQKTRLASFAFSPDGKRLAFTVTRDAGVELWVAEVATGQAKALTDATLNATLGAPCEWLSDNTGLLCRFVPAGRGPAPAAPAVPAGPNIQENLGTAAPVRTYQDLLETATDEALFEHYFTSRLAIVDAAGGKRTSIGRPAIFEQAELSPNRDYLIVARIKRPFSRLVPASDFPKEIEIWNRKGDVVRKIADLPVADTVPINGVSKGPRRVQWRPDRPASVVWVEALDEGDPKRQVPHRDRVVVLEPPFNGEPAELARLGYRFRSAAWTDKGLALVEEYDRATRRTRTWIIGAPGAEPRTLWDRSAESAYDDPGTPVIRPGSGPRTILQSGDSIFVTGPGASPQGARPFLDRVDLKTLSTERLFRSDDKSYETVITVLADDGRSILTRYETKTDPPNYVVRDLSAGEKHALTSFTDPAPQLAGIQKQLVTYQRKDGVTLSATLYLPPGYQKGQRLPMLMWAYPREFTDPAAAGQITGSAHRFTTVGGASHLLLLTQGYAIFDDPKMPIVGKGETANDGYVDQLVGSAQAAVDKVVEMGVADRDRIGIGGHSYGAFMTANLLAHSDLFRAGIARSGAYNRTLTPFGFQNEIRTFWEAPEVYARMSPFWFAHKVNEPVLLIHGEADNNSGTFPIQSERFYMALKGHGATVRYVTLPLESHGYAARESVLHTVAEMLKWCDTYVRNARPRETTSAGR